MFSDATRLYSGRIELYESTNIIEVHIEEKLIENGNSSPWNDGNAIVGVQGDAASGEAVTAPCRGIDPNWEVLNTPTTRERTFRKSVGSLRVGYGKPTPQKFRTEGRSRKVTRKIH